MEIKILQVFLGEDNLPYKDKERTVHFPIVGAAFKGASNTTKIRFYYDKLVEQDDEDTTTWVAVSKLPNGKIGSKVLESEYDEELGEHYALFELESFYTQYKGDLFISLQGYQGGVQVITDQDTGISQIVGTPTIQATGSIKLAINYATQFIGSGETTNVNFQRILADLGTKLGIRTITERVDELPTIGQTNVFYAVPDESDTNKVNIYVWNGTTQSYVWVGDNSLYLGNYYTTQQGNAFEQEVRDTIGNGSPKGVYSTLADLQAAYPSGTNGIYVVSANGHWYYWNGSAWTDGGQYLANNNEPYYFKTNNEELPDTIIDLDNFPMNASYQVTQNKTSSQLANCPFYPFQGGIMDFTINVSQNIVRMQIAYAPDNGGVYFRTKWATWGTWKEFATSSDIARALLASGNGEPIITDLNDASLISKTYYVALAKQSNELANAPFYPFQGIISTITSGDNDLVYQFVFSPYNFNMYYRVKWGTWGEWKHIFDIDYREDLIISKGSLENSGITDLNDTRLTNTMYRLTTNSSQSDISNAPFYPFQGNIITMATGGNYCQTQFVQSPDGDLYYRVKWDAWYAWNEVPKTTDITNVPPLDISMFERIGVIGDSYASGELYNSSGVQLGDYYNMSWLQIMARKNDFTGYNFSVGGETTGDFLTNVDHGLPKLKASPKCGLYLLCLGINDMSYTTLGTIADINDSDPSLNPNTFYGNYGKIIEEIKSYSPNSLFIFFTTAAGSPSSPYNVAIREIAQHYGIPCIETMNNKYFNSSWYTNNMYSNHPTAPVYAMMSKQYQEMIEQCIYDNVSYFRDYTGQGLD